MVLIQVNLSKEVDKEIKIYMAINGFSNKESAIIDILNKGLNNE